MHIHLHIKGFILLFFDSFAVMHGFCHRGLSKKQCPHPYFWGELNRTRHSLQTTTIPLLVGCAQFHINFFRLELNLDGSQNRGCTVYALFPSFSNSVHDCLFFLIFLLHLRHLTLPPLTHAANTLSIVVHTLCPVVSILNLSFLLFRIMYVVLCITFITYKTDVHHRTCGEGVTISSS